MTTMLEALQSGFDLQNKRDKSTDFARKLTIYRDEIVKEYMNNKGDLNNLIIEYCKKHNLHGKQIDRLSQEINNQIYLIKYSKIKSENEKEVVFDLADPDKIKSSLSEKSSDKDVAENKDKNENKEKSNIKKTASDNSDTSNIFNGLQHKMPAMSMNLGITKEEFLLKKIANKICEFEDGLDKMAYDVKMQGHKIADTIVKMKYKGCDDICEKIANEKFTAKDVGLIKEACEDRIQILKSQKAIASEYEFDLDLDMLNKKADEMYSLGKFSLIKCASTFSEKEELPKIITFTDELIDSEESLNKLASDYIEKVAEFKRKYDEYCELAEKCSSAGVTAENIEKCANSVPKGFFNLVTGRSKRAAGKALEDSIIRVNNLINNNKPLQEGVEQVEKLTNKLNKVKNQAPNMDRRVREAQNTLDYFKDANKTVMDNYATKGMFGKMFDKEGKQAKKHLDMLEKNVAKEHRDFYKRNQEAQMRLSKELDGQRAAINNYKRDIGLDKLQQEHDQAQAMYDKALKRTSQARVAAGVGAVGTSAYVKSKKNNAGYGTPYGYNNYNGF